MTKESDSRENMHLQAGVEISLSSLVIMVKNRGKMSAYNANVWTPINNYLSRCHINIYIIIHWDMLF